MRAFFLSSVTLAAHASFCLCDERMGTPHHGYPCSPRCMVRHRSAGPVEGAEVTDVDLVRTIIAANVTFFLILAVWWFMNRRK